MESLVKAALREIVLKDVEEWREYDFAGRTYRIEKPTKVQFSAGGSTHRVTDSNNVVHVVPAPGTNGCVMRFVGDVIA